MKTLFISGLLFSTLGTLSVKAYADTYITNEIDQAISNCAYNTSREGSAEDRTFHRVASKMIMAGPAGYIHPVFAVMLISNAFRIANKYHDRHTYIRNAYESGSGARFSQFVENIQTVDDRISKEKIIDVLVEGLLAGEVCNYRTQAYNTIDEMEAFILKELNLEEKFYNEILDADPTLFDGKAALLF